MTLVFRDDFEGDTLRPVWQTRAVTYDDVARPDPRAVAVEDGLLRLRTIRDPDRPGKYLNGHVGTQGRFEFLYGRAAARVRVHPHHGSHCSFWLAPTSDYEPGQAEVDVMEYFGAHDPDRKTGVNVWHNVYWREPGQGAGEFTSVKIPTNNLTLFTPSWYQKFHTYEVRWTPRRYRFFIDNVPVAEVSQSVSYLPKYLVLSMLTKGFEVEEMGTHSAGDGITFHPIESYVMDVAWVKVWQRS